MITINVKEETWKELNKRKQVGETFNEVINRMLLEFPTITNDGKRKNINDKQR